MIHTPIQETPVMGHQNKSLLFSQILRYNLSAMCIQMIGRLIDQQKMSFIQKQCCKKDFRLFSVGKCLKRTPKHFFIHFQSVKFLPYLPLFCLRTLLSSTLLLPPNVKKAARKSIPAASHSTNHPHIRRMRPMIHICEQDS